MSAKWLVRDGNNSFIIDVDTGRVVLTRLTGPMQIPVSSFGFSASAAKEIGKCLRDAGDELSKVKR